MRGDSKEPLIARVRPGDASPSSCIPERMTVQLSTDRGTQQQAKGSRAEVAADGRSSERLRLRARVEVLALKAALRLVRNLPIDLVSWSGGVVASMAAPYTRRNKRVMSNIGRAFPCLSLAERQHLARRMWENYGRTIAETMMIDRVAADSSRVVLENPEWVHARLKGIGGAVFVGLHFGNWEATIIPALRLGLSPIGLYKPLKNPEANAILLSLRKELYPSGLLPANAKSAMRAVRHVRRGGAICMLADHRDLSGVAVPFFGQPAPSTTLPALLSVSFDVPLFLARVDRIGGARFSVHVEEVEVSCTGHKDEDVRQTTAAVQSRFEAWIKERPEAWVWCYKRWMDQRRGRPGQ